MKNCMKKHVNRFLAFCMTWIMVVASVTVTPMTVNAEAAGDEVTTLTVYFENQKGWDRIYTKFGLDDNWAEIAGYEYCMKDYGELSVSVVIPSGIVFLSKSIILCLQKAP